MYLILYPKVLLTNAEKLFKVQANTPYTPKLHPSLDFRCGGVLYIKILSLLKIFPKFWQYCVWLALSEMERNYIINADMKNMTLSSHYQMNSMEKCSI